MVRLLRGKGRQQASVVKAKPLSSVKPKNGNFFLLWASAMSIVSILMLLQSTWVSKSIDGSKGKGLESLTISRQDQGPLSPFKLETVKDKPKVLTAFIESTDTVQGDYYPLPRRTTHRSQLTKKEFPAVQSCETLTQDFGKIVNSFGNFSSTQNDPYLPWLHDFSLSNDNSRLIFVSQNRRNCDTGKDRKEIMEFWSPQLSLFQSVPIARTDHQNGSSSFRIAGDTDKSTDDETIIPETRFLCRFHSNSEEDNNMQASSSITLSKFSFNYEYVSWRKAKAMVKEDDHKQSEFWISQLIFYCDIPPQFQSGLQQPSPNASPRLWVDVIPIRTPPRAKFWLTPQMIGPQLYQQHQASANFFDAKATYGNDHALPQIADSGRWANLPVCPRAANSHLDKAASTNDQSPTTTDKPYSMVLCTWTSASYHRRGEDEDQPMDDTVLRLREWLIFHRMVGFEHVVIYDNSQGIDDYHQSPIYQLLQEFPEDFVTHQPWPALICNNHRPGHANPGDRSSQYAAEASCRERYGPLTTWMAFVDTDEYLTPMRKDNNLPATTWKPVLEVRRI